MLGEQLPLNTSNVKEAYTDSFTALAISHVRRALSNCADMIKLRMHNLFTYVY